MKKTYEELERECEALRVDAERYRWLRETVVDDENQFSFPRDEGYWTWWEYVGDCLNEEFDSAIDKAIGETKG
jgi:hypothetical protein